MPNHIETGGCSVDSSRKNALSVDVEDYFQVSAFEPYISRDEWPGYENRILANTDRILRLFDDADVKATFFFLGWVAERYPSLLRQVADLGHEIASHGFCHIQVSNQDKDEFTQDVNRTKRILEDVTGQPIYGYRAASFSITASNHWVYDVLAESGHRYSSSIFPIRHYRYGMRDAPRFPYRSSDRRIVELPVTTVELAGLRFPCGGGGYFRLLPYAWTKWAIRRVNASDRQSGMFYFHPWEIDYQQPRVRGPNPVARFRHYVNLKSFDSKLIRLLQDFRWTTVMSAFGDVIRLP